MRLRSSNTLRALGFLLLFVLLQLGWQAMQGSGAKEAVLAYAVTGPAVALIHWLTPDVAVHAVGRQLQAAGGGLWIQNGCEGLEAAFLLWSAVCVTPVALLLRWQGLLLGTAVVFVLNQARILLLFYVWRHSPALFDLLHATLVPVGVVLLVCGYFALWLQHVRGRLASAT